MGRGEHHRRRPRPRARARGAAARRRDVIERTGTASPPQYQRHPGAGPSRCRLLHRGAGMGRKHARDAAGFEGRSPQALPGKQCRVQNPAVPARERSPSPRASYEYAIGIDCARRPRPKNDATSSRAHGAAPRQDPQHRCRGLQARGHAAPRAAALDDARRIRSYPRGRHAAPRRAPSSLTSSRGRASVRSAAQRELVGRAALSESNRGAFDAPLTAASARTSSRPARPRVKAEAAARGKDARRSRTRAGRGARDARQARVARQGRRRGALSPVAPAPQPEGRPWPTSPPCSPRAPTCSRRRRTASPRRPWRLSTPRGSRDRTCLRRRCRSLPRPRAARGPAAAVAAVGRDHLFFEHRFTPAGKPLDQHTVDV